MWLYRSLTQNLEQRKCFPCPDQFSGQPHRVSDLHWVSTHVFAAVYTPVSSSENTPSLMFLFTSVSRPCWHHCYCLVSRPLLHLLCQCGCGLKMKLTIVRNTCVCYTAVKFGSLVANVQFRNIGGFLIWRYGVTFTLCICTLKKFLQ